MWIPIKIRHDNNALRIFERTLEEHIADELNKLEKEKGAIKYIHQIEHIEDQLTTLVVRVEDDLTDRATMNS